MVVTGVPRRKSRRYDGAEATAFPRFDLLREQRQQDEFLARLDALHRPVSEAVAGLYRRMFNNGSVKLSMSTWRERLPKADFWLAATTIQRPGQTVYFGLSTQTLFLLSELFFGNSSDGRSAEVRSDAASLQRNVSETEERLARRLFLHQLTELAAAIGLAATAWDIRWVAERPATALLCCEVVFSTDQLQCEWQLCWPASLDAAPVIEIPPDLDRSLHRALVRIPVRLRVEVATQATSLGKLGRLRAGEVLPLELHDQAVARIGAVSCCRGRVAEDDGELVLQVTRLMEASDEGR